jgi:hypothetical protein
MAAIWTCSRNRNDGIAGAKADRSPALHGADEESMAQKETFASKPRIVAMVRTMHGWAIDVLQNAGAIRECEDHGWMQDRGDMQGSGPSISPA